MTDVGRFVLSLVTSLVASSAACHAPPPPPSSPTRPPSSAVASAPAAPAVVALREGVTLRALAPGVWVHSSTFQHPRFGLTPANGLLVAADAEALLVDTGWSDAQAEALLDWAIDAGRRRLRGVVLTHAHEDRAGGLGAVLARGVPTYALAATAERVGRAGFRPNLIEPGGQRLRVGGGEVELFFPGVGHAPDNLVVYAPADRVLFGGCLVKDLSSQGLGNLADADVGAWPGSVAAVARRFADARVVVPGHGEAGGPALLQHTLSLLARAGGS